MVQYAMHGEIGQKCSIISKFTPRTTTKQKGRPALHEVTSDNRQRDAGKKSKHIFVLMRNKYFFLSRLGSYGS
jgi:hypothetical protein